jgi:hypothetical protein
MLSSAINEIPDGGLPVLRHYRVLLTGLSLALLAILATAVFVTAASRGGILVGMVPTAHFPGAPAVAPTRPGSVPSFTTQDVIDYVNKHGTDWTTPGQVTVTAVESINKDARIARR